MKPGKFRNICVLLGATVMGATGLTAAAVQPAAAHSTYGNGLIIFNNSNYSVSLNPIGNLDDEINQSCVGGTNPESLSVGAAGSANMDIEMDRGVECSDGGMFAYSYNISYNGATFSGGLAALFDDSNSFSQSACAYVNDYYPDDQPNWIATEWTPCQWNGQQGTKAFSATGTMVVYPSNPNGMYLNLVPMNGPSNAIYDPSLWGPCSASNWFGCVAVYAYNNPPSTNSVSAQAIGQTPRAQQQGSYRPPGTVFARNRRPQTSLSVARVSQKLRFAIKGRYAAVSKALRIPRTRGDIGRTATNRHAAKLVVLIDGVAVGRAHSRFRSLPLTGRDGKVRQTTTMNLDKNATKRVCRAIKNGQTVTAHLVDQHVIATPSTSYLKQADKIKRLHRC